MYGLDNQFTFQIQKFHTLSACLLIFDGNFVGFIIYCDWQSVSIYETSVNFMQKKKREAKVQEMYTTHILSCVIAQYQSLIWDIFQ